MTQLVFALVVTLGGQTISTEYWRHRHLPLYAKRLNSQHHHVYHRHHPKNESIHAKCLPRRVDPAPSRYSTVRGSCSLKHSPVQKSAVDGIKSAIDGEDVGEIVDELDKLFTGEQQIQKKKQKANDPFLSGQQPGRRSTQRSPPNIARRSPH